MAESATSGAWSTRNSTASTEPYSRNTSICGKGFRVRTTATDSTATESITTISSAITGSPVHRLAWLFAPVAAPPHPFGADRGVGDHGLEHQHEHRDQQRHDSLVGQGLARPHGGAHEPRGNGRGRTEEMDAIVYVRHEPHAEHAEQLDDPGGPQEQGDESGGAAHPWPHRSMNRTIISVAPYCTTMNTRARSK